MNFLAYEILTYSVSQIQSKTVERVSTHCIKSNSTQLQKIDVHTTFKNPTKSNKWFVAKPSPHSFGQKQHCCNPTFRELILFTFNFCGWMAICFLGRDMQVFIAVGKLKWRRHVWAGTKWRQNKRSSLFRLAIHRSIWEISLEVNYKEE